MVRRVVHGTPVRHAAAAIVAVLAVGAVATPAEAAAGSTGSASAVATVRYRGVSVEAPTSWPVRLVAGRPGCVRLDRHAVYLGDPSRSTCPAHLVGRTTAVHVTARGTQGLTGPDRVVTAVARRLAVVVTAGSSPATARRIAASVRFTGATAVVRAPQRPTAVPDRVTATSAPAARRTFRVATAFSTRASAKPRFSDTTFTGQGFDACTAQPLTTMAAWYAASPYKAANLYIGGASRGCDQPNLTADWVTQTIAQGWTLIPTYVGLQAPCVTRATIVNRIDPAQAGAQGAAAADDAVAQMAALGLKVGNPIYFDMEGFPYSDVTCRLAVLTFLDAWTERVHAQGFVSGVYGSSGSTIKSMVDNLPNPAFTQPDALWIARWCPDLTACDNSTGDVEVPVDRWNNRQRIRQWRGGHLETWGGQTVNIDNNTVDAPVAPSQLAAEGAFFTVVGRPETFRIAGGAPVLVTDWAAVGGQAASVQSLSPTQFASLPSRPAEGTFLQSGATGRIYRVVNGVATYVPSWTPYGAPQPSTVIDQAALDNAGLGGVWNVLVSGVPTARMTSPAGQAALGGRARFDWFGGYSSSAVATYDVRWRKAPWNGSFGRWLTSASSQGTPATGLPLGVKTGYSTCVSVRARNRAGQVSAWTSQSCALKPLDDRVLVASTGWKRRSRPGYYNGSAVSTTRRGATLTRTGARAGRIGVVANTCPGCGSLVVLVNGKRIGRINLAGVPGKRRVLLLPSRSPVRGTVALRVRSAGLPVYVDGIVLGRG